MSEARVLAHAASDADRYIAEFERRGGFPTGYSPEKVRALVSACEASPAPGISWIPYFDIERLMPLAQRFIRVPEVVDDIAQMNPGQWFAAHYCNPYNLVFDIDDGAGFIAFLRVAPGWKAQVYFGAWDRRAMRAYEVWKHAARVAMLAWDLHIIEGFQRVENIHARRVAHRVGMTFRGIIRTPPLYNRPEVPVVWFEIGREALGLPMDSLDDLPA